MTTVGDLRRWDDQLSRGDSYACGYEHHCLDPDGTDLPLCPSAVSNYRHGCAHALRYMLDGVIGEMRLAGFLTEAEANRAFSAVNYRHVLFQDDSERQGRITEEAELIPLLRRQREIIAKREAITADLRRRIREKLREFGSGRVELTMVS